MRVHYIFDKSGRPLAEHNASTGALIREYYWIGDLLVAQSDGISDFAVHGGHLGQPLLMTNAAQMAVWDAEYDPFGGALTTTSTEDNELRYPGQWAEAESGLVHNWHRDYDPTLGRYLQADPLGLAAGQSLYGYVGGSPLNYVDPAGLQFRTTCMDGVCVTFPEEYSNNARGTEAEKKGRELAERFNLSRPGTPNYHAYPLTTELCEISPSCTLEQIHRRLTELTPPQMICDTEKSNCSGVGLHMLYDPLNFCEGTNPIDTWSNSSEFASGNDTLPGHMFHFGQVIHQLFEHDGKIYLHTLGTGTGGNKFFNETVGPPLIGQTHDQLLYEH